jgi:hypothetical protein
MSDADLNTLEREVEITRAKFAHDLARLRSPHSLAEFKEDLWAHARGTKDGIVADLKARAAANPAALAAVAAGVAWRLFHRPPIAQLADGIFCVTVDPGFRVNTLGRGPQQAEQTQTDECRCAQSSDCPPRFCLGDAAL